MAKGQFPCPKCDRSFSMAAHLARHTYTIHGTKAGRPGRRSRSAGKAAAGRRRIVAGRSSVNVEAARLIGEMQTYRRDLTDQRTQLDHRIAALDGALTALGAVGAASAGAPGRNRSRGQGRRGRPRGRSRAGNSLKNQIVQSLRKAGTPMNVRQIATQVVKDGYATSSKDLSKAVSNALAQLPGVNKVGRGIYRAR